MRHCYLLTSHLNVLCNRMDIYVHTSSGQWIIEETFNGFTCTPISPTNTASIFLSIRPQNIVTTYMLRTDRNKYFNRIMVYCITIYIVFLKCFSQVWNIQFFFLSTPFLIVVTIKWAFPYQIKTFWKENNAHLVLLPNLD